MPKGYSKLTGKPIIPAIYIGQKIKGKENHQWKGDKVSYRGLHKWLQRCLGNPTTCENCGRRNLTGRQIHWANVSQEYKRDLDDWVRLCQRCHQLIHGFWLKKPKNI